MSLHHCMQNPCPVCSSRNAWMPTSVTRALAIVPSNATFTATTWGIPVTQRFYTWREAILTALASDTTMRPTVRRDADGKWVVRTYQQPIAYNQETA